MNLHACCGGEQCRTSAPGFDLNVKKAFVYNAN